MECERQQRDRTGSVEPLLAPPDLFSELALVHSLQNKHAASVGAIGGQTGDDGAYLPDLGIRVLPERVDVGPQSALEHGGILRDYAQPGSQVVQPYCANVDTVDQDLPARWINHAEQGLYEG